MRLDSHHHFWNYNAIEYAWIGDYMAALRRDFGPPDLQFALESAGIDGAIVVQARQTLDETKWLLELAQTHDFLRGVVGWVPLCAPDVADVLAEFAAYPKLVAARHVVQAEPDDFLARPDFNRGIAALERFGLVYDILIVERQLPAAIALVDAHPNQSFVLDHIAKPRIASGEMEPWAAGIRALAKRPNVVCKVSGLVTEADLRNWTSEQLRPYFEIVLEAFGPHRSMFGSDWPVCLAATSYAHWAATVRAWTRGFSQSEAAALWGETAARVYKL